MEEEIERAKARIKELQTLVKHWEKAKPSKCELEGLT